MVDERVVRGSGSKRLTQVAVIGSGLMGHGIAQVAATSGQEVTLIDIKDEFLARGMQRITDSLTKFAEKGPKVMVSTCCSSPSVLRIWLRRLMAS